MQPSLIRKNESVLKKRKRSIEENLLEGGRRVEGLTKWSGERFEWNGPRADRIYTEKSFSKGETTRPHRVLGEIPIHSPTGLYSLFLPPRQPRLKHLHYEKDENDDGGH